MVATLLLGTAVMLLVRVMAAILPMEGMGANPRMLGMETKLVMEIRQQLQLQLHLQVGPRQVASAKAVKASVKMARCRGATSPSRTAATTPWRNARMEPASSGLSMPANLGPVETTMLPSMDSTKP